MFRRVILRYILMLAVLAAVSLRVAQTSVMEKPLVPVSVCEVLSNRGLYDDIQTQQELPTVVAGDGKSVFPAGYGHLNGAPAQVIYKDKDLIIIPDK